MKLRVVLRQHLVPLCAAVAAKSAPFTRQLAPGMMMARRSDGMIPLRGFGSTSGSEAAAQPQSARGELKRVTIVDVQKKKKKGEKITMCTACDYPSAQHVDRADIDILLVGDSLGMVELGHDTTLPVSMDEMVHHARAVSRATKRPLLVGDMPFGTYEASREDAIRNAMRFLKEASMDCVKMEGGRARAETVRAVVQSGVAVMGHVGLTPQAFSAMGGFRAQGRTASNAYNLLLDALALQDAGCFAVVLECVPDRVARVVTDALRIPTIGIGAGAHTSGQVLVFHDLCGMTSHPHHAQVAPRFCKQYAHVGHVIQDALEAYRNEVVQGQFPAAEHSPYTISDAQWTKFEEMVREKSASSDGRGDVPAAEEPSETTKVY